jgi:hypothetical protein
MIDEASTFGVIWLVGQLGKCRRCDKLGMGEHKIMGDIDIGCAPCSTNQTSQTFFAKSCPRNLLNSDKKKIVEKILVEFFL